VFWSTLFLDNAAEGGVKPLTVLEARMMPLRFANHGCKIFRSIDYNVILAKTKLSLKRFHSTSVCLYVYACKSISFHPCLSRLVLCVTLCLPCLALCLHLSLLMSLSLSLSLYVSHSHVCVCVCGVWCVCY
jgi:hypothetical protein